MSDCCWKKSQSPLSASLPVWLTARLDSINTLGSTRNNCVCECVSINLPKSPTCWRYLHITGQWNYLHSFLSLSWLSSFPFSVFYWVSFSDFNTCALRAAGMCVRYKWELMNGACPRCPTCVIGLHFKDFIDKFGQLFIIFRILEWYIKRDGGRFQDGLLEYTGSRPVEDWFWRWPYARQALKKHITAH